ncbi:MULTISPECIES: hypothetical protein [Nocardia]|uniref:Uncharacterized protein n=1 Tax=Nocardia aurea TaxID=2144174 RepID=A0ABV3G1I3_9NOCA|nr:MULTISPECIES: hypothetical protein [Nocardia]
MSQEDGHVPGLFSHENVAEEVYTPADTVMHYPVFSGAEDGSFRAQAADGDA